MSYGLEAIYCAGWMLSSVAALYLAKWKLRNLIIYLATAATIFAAMNGARELLHGVAPYVVELPC